MRTREEQIALLEHLLDIARKRKEVGETEWLEFKTNISESHSSITYEGVGKYISGISNVACLKDKAYGFWYWVFKTALGMLLVQISVWQKRRLATRIMNYG